MPNGRPLRSGARPAFAVLSVLAVLACFAAAPVVAQDEECDLAPTDPSICLLEDRFKVEIEWKEFSGNPFTLPGRPDSGVGQGVTLAPGSGATKPNGGYFWFHDQSEPEVVIKILDGRMTNGGFWVFYGSLTDVEYRITVTDTQTQRQVEYTNEPGEFSFERDTDAFPEEPPKAAERAGAGFATPGAGAQPVQRAILPANGLPSCGDPNVACVQGDRFAIEGFFLSQNPENPPVPSQAVLTTETSAILRFFDDESGDAAVKVLDGRAVNGSFWVFATVHGVTDVELRVTDLETGKATTYTTPLASGLALGDRQPFAPDPPSQTWLETPELPGFRFQTRITAGGAEVASRQEADCVPETLCISGAVPGRSELFLRIVGPKPNGFLQPNVVKFSTSTIEVWVEQLATGLVNYYLLEGATPGSSDLTGFFDRFGFGPPP